jgi:hypothetical protein
MLLKPSVTDTFRSVFSACVNRPLTDQQELRGGQCQELLDRRGQQEQLRRIGQHV